MSDELHDPVVAQALHEIDVPAYSSGFWDRLELRLERDGAVPLPGEPTLVGDATLVPLPRRPRVAERRRSLIVLVAAAAVVVAVLAVRLTSDDATDVQVASDVEADTQPNPGAGGTTTLAALRGATRPGAVAGAESHTDGAASADGGADQGAGATAGTGGVGSPTTTVATFGATTGPAIVRTGSTRTAQDTFATWAAAVHAGDADAAIALTGPRTLAYYDALGTSPKAVIAGAEDEWGRWADPAGRRIDVIELGSVAGQRVVGVVLQRPATSAKAAPAYDAVPLVQGDDGWRVEPAAFDPDRDSRIELISPAPGPDGLQDLPKGGQIRVAAAKDGDYYLGLDLDPDVSTRIPASSAVDGQVRWNPGPQKPGSTHLLVVAHVADGEIVMLAAPFGAAA